MRDPEVRYTKGEKPMAIASFNLAVDRERKKDGEQSADFISCKAFGKTAEVIEKYVKRGTKIGVTGRIQTGSYEKEGKKVYTTDVNVDKMEFMESKGSAASGGASNPIEETQVGIPSGFSLSDSDIPF